MTIEDRMADIEIRIVSTEDMVDTLNRTVYRQQQKIDELEALCTALARQLKETRDTMHEGRPANEKPPHY